MSAVLDLYLRFWFCSVLQNTNTTTNNNKEADFRFYIYFNLGIQGPISTIRLAFKNFILKT